jgi:hypothetical protein
LQRLFREHHHHTIATTSSNIENTRLDILYFANWHTYSVKLARLATISFVPFTEKTNACSTVQDVGGVSSFASFLSVALQRVPRRRRAPRRTSFFAPPASMGDSFIFFRSLNSTLHFFFFLRGVFFSCMCHDDRLEDAVR